VLSSYFLPLLAATLKTRRRKLAQMNTTTNSAISIENSNNVTGVVKTFVSDLNAKQVLLQTIKPHSIENDLNSFTLQTGIFRQFNLSVVSRAQLTTIFF
jgi:hypothetical protein